MSERTLILGGEVIDQSGRRRADVANADPRSCGNDDCPFRKSADPDERCGFLQHAGVLANDRCDSRQHLIEIGGPGDVHRDFDLTDAAVIVQDLADNFAIGYDDLRQIRVQQDRR